ncbi:UDP-N-acetylmuramoyl-tripeptide--D-alanyl-D-alanine ligase [Blattabacterium cuenoti]|uniref:UDP-N-acetylmuramoyl-tripeptide--D-alanyl-D- alanine ligase n=1 Tax=Blattabacterium cuenoti TaxID=1653831 RepID=UPI00163BBB28|nr:UDP-N-acetylmuramoyl-tripeptide--D-alanyl-D-alanine ligase [Blattabacterium cuenoti]
MKIKEIYQKYYSISSGIEINSKKVKKGSIFIALKGKNFDGNQFALEAISKGALLSIIDNKKYFVSCKKILLVKNTLFLLQELAFYHRSINKHIPIIAIVGSNGKTTTKELIRSVLYNKYKKIHYTKNNYNNHIGIPLTILSMSNNSQISVIEIGASHKNEIKNMCSIVNPDYGYITNFGKAHLEGFGGIKGVINGKLELYEFLKKKNKLVFVNGDDSIQISNSNKIKRFVFSGKKNINTNVKFKYLCNISGIKSILYIKNIKIVSSLVGNYNLYNIAASITIGIYFKISLKKIKKSIEEYTSKNYRSQIINKNNVKIIVDCYNANPTSMIKSLTFFNKNINGNKMVILGDMLELGSFSNKEHEKIIYFLTKSDINIAFLIGYIFFNTKYIKSNKTEIIKFLEKKNFINWIKKNPIRKTNFIFVKGSRKIELENIIPFINPI